MTGTKTALATYVATLSNGETVHRNSAAREYTHVVEATPTVDGVTAAVSWHAGLAAARQAAATASARKFYTAVALRPVARLPYDSPEALAVRDAALRKVR
ncbi:hypothetical protein [Nocardia wallacei]|uniref:hypothetical protein n=1 Tax=Nocardia wallacei TaxID=480035 RepID=UPI002455CC96|nr:hypothetical protein [Nocardia wallacei]